MAFIICLIYPTCNDFRYPIWSGLQAEKMTIANFPSADRVGEDKKQKSNKSSIFMFCIVFSIVKGPEKILGLIF